MYFYSNLETVQSQPILCWGNSDPLVVGVDVDFKVKSTNEHLVALNFLAMLINILRMWLGLLSSNMTTINPGNFTVD